MHFSFEHIVSATEIFQNQLKLKKFDFNMHHSPEPNFHLNFPVSYMFEAVADYTGCLEHKNSWDNLRVLIRNSMSKIITLPAGSLADRHRNLMETKWFILFVLAAKYTFSRGRTIYFDEDKL